MSERPVCIYSAKVIWQRGWWVLSWHRRRVGLSRFWICWPQFRRGIRSTVVFKADA